MTTGDISDTQITSSSTYPANWDAGCNERYGRLYQPNGLAWCAKYKSASEWLQVDLGVPAKVLYSVLLYTSAHKLFGDVSKATRCNGKTRFSITC